MKIDSLVIDSVLRIGEVSEVDGRRVYIKVDKNKNLSDIFFEGDVLKNISVNSYIEIRKGFLSIVGKVDGERIEEDQGKGRYADYEHTNRNKRFLSVSLSGYLTRKGQFVGGTKELPLIGNEAYILTKEKLHQIHNLLKQKNDLAITIATSEADGFDVSFPIDGLFNSHIAVFGNTGSGKSNTLAALYQELCKTLSAQNLSAFQNKSKFLLFDFNGEYIENECITKEKEVYNLSTRVQGDKIPVDQNSILDLEILSILADATEKTQKPFLKRALKFYNQVLSKEDPLSYFKAVLRGELTRTLQLSDKVKAFLLIDYFKEILPELPDPTTGIETDLISDLDWHNTYEIGFKTRNPVFYLQSNPGQIPNTTIYLQVEQFNFDANFLKNIITILYYQLIHDVLANRAQNEHVAPVINKLKSKLHDIESIFDLDETKQFWNKNFIVINLHDVNLDMKKTIPLLLSKKVYSEQKLIGDDTSLTIIIDEAHNILSRESHRESEGWKDYRLETFEEIIKEGRKFGVFVTISSQRPNDISPTITSQAHNYFIHRLINQRDLETISSAVSYIDKITEESIPTLPTGTCVFSGIASQMPLKINVKELAHIAKPQSHTVKFKDIVPPLTIEDV